MNNVKNGKEFIEHQLNGKVVDLNNPTCNYCNECCSLLTMISEEEYLKLKKYLTKDKHGRQIFESSVKGWIKTGEKCDLNLMCPFSNKNKRCAIYNIRPSICRKFHCKSSLNLLSVDEKLAIENNKHFTIYDLVKLYKK